MGAVKAALDCYYVKWNRTTPFDRLGNEHAVRMFEDLPGARWRPGFAYTQADIEHPKRLQQGFVKGT